MTDDSTSSQQLDVELEENIAEGVYTNLAIVNYSISEFVIDFISIMPGVPKSRVKSRVILTPQNAKRLLKAMEDNVYEFEDIHGEIKEYEQPSLPLSFGPTGEV